MADLYRWVVAKPARACRTCREMDGQVMSLEAWIMLGILPGFHPGCSCRLEPDTSRSGEGAAAAVPGVAAGDLPGNIWEGIDGAVVGSLRSLSPKITWLYGRNPVPGRRNWL